MPPWLWRRARRGARRIRGNAAPADESLYRDGEPVPLRATASDPEDGSLSGASIRWKVVLHHKVHTHPFDRLEGGSASFTPLRDHDAGSYYEITATAVDSGGLTARRTIQIRPETVRLTVRSEPAGAPVPYAGTSRVAPFTTDAAIGFAAGTEFVAQDNRPYVFDHWADGGEQSRTVRVPDADLALTAVYRLKDPHPPDTIITRGPGSITFERAPRFEFDTVEIRATDLANNVDPTPARATFTVIGLFG